MKLNEFEPTKPFEFDGFWQFPDSEDRYYPGRFKSAGNFRFYLSIFGVPVEMVFTAPHASTGTPYILGLSEHGQEITLIENYTMNSEFRSNGLGRITFLVGSAIVGAHISNVDRAKIKSTVVSPRCLGKWAKTIVQLAKNKASELKIQINKYIHLLDSNLKGISIGIEGLHNERIEEAGYAVSTRFIPYVRYTFDPYVEISAFRKVIYYNEVLFSLLKGDPLHNFKVLIDIENDGEIANAAYLYTKSGDSSFGCQSNSSLILFKPDAAWWTRLFKRWWNLVDELSPAIDLYYLVESKSVPYIEIQFLNMTTALEVCHRTHKKISWRERQEHEVRLQVILDAVPAEYREWLRAKLQYNYEPTLRERIVEIVDFVLTTAPAMREVFGNRSNIKRFVHQVVETRNNLVHRGSGGAGRLYKKEDLLELVRFVRLLKLLFKVCIFIHLGLSNGRAGLLNKIVTSSPDFVFIKSRF